MTQKHGKFAFLNDPIDKNPFIYHNNDNEDPMVGQKVLMGKSQQKNMLFFASHQKESICDRLRISFMV